MRAMIAFGGKLTEQEILDVVTYVKGLDKPPPVQLRSGQARREQRREQAAEDDRGCKKVNEAAGRLHR